MLIALLIALGVNLAIILLLSSLVIGRRRWLKRQPGTFTGAIRASEGDVEGLPSEWKKGTGRWVRDVLVWSQAPFMYQNDLIPIDGIAGRRLAVEGEIKRIGDAPAVIALASGDATIEVATPGRTESLATGPFSSPPAPGDIDSGH